jgi:5-methylcytosine-specific restriction endonuclease McrA
MPWVKLDDSFFCHPKVITAGAEASGLYVWALTYSAHNLTDGHVPAAWVKQAVGSRTKKLAATLVEQGLWTQNGTGWMIHDYHDYQPSKADVEVRRDWDSKRKALFQDKDLVAAVRTRDRDHCRYCDLPVNWKDRKGKRGATYDHVTPRGQNTLENIVVACFECNGKKGHRTPEQAGMNLTVPRSDLDHV